MNGVMSVTLSIRQTGQVYLGEDELTDDGIVARLSATAKDPPPWSAAGRGGRRWSSSARPP
jgi:biopolymer transport protein TolR